MRQLITYAQNREDLILEAMLKTVKKGVYVDVGANHPVNHSVTKKFYDRGWSGINIEPIPKYIKLLRKLRRRDTNLQVCIGDKAGKLTFRQYENSGISTLSQEMMEQNKESGIDDYTEYEVEVKTLASVLEEANYETIHFLKVDVEGYEYEVLKSNDWKLYRPVIVCIESNHEPSRDWSKLLKQNGYTVVFNDGLNDYYVADERKDMIKGFDFPEEVLAGGKVIVPHPLLHEIRSREHETELVRKKLDKVKQRDAALRRQINEQNRIMRDGFGVRYHAEMLLKAIKNKLLRR